MHSKRLLQFSIFIALCSIFFLYPGEISLFQRSANNSLAFGESHKEVAPASQPTKIMVDFLPSITANGYFVIDKDTGTPILQNNGHDKFFPASTTKIITALTILDYLSPGDILTIKRSLLEGQHLGFQPGQKFTLENLLFAILVHSANDGAYAIADNYPKGYGAFIQKMNEKAKSLGLTNSNFKNPAGLDDPAQYTTPFDLALAARNLLLNPLLARIVATKSITISDVNFNDFYELSNVNRLLGTIPGVGGLKTGFTEVAGQNLVSFYRHEGHDFIIVVVKSTDRFQDTENIINWIKINIVYKNPLLPIPSPKINQVTPTSVVSPSIFLPSPSPIPQLSPLPSPLMRPSLRKIDIR